jgi:CheY-like chemotaxis protein
MPDGGHLRISVENRRSSNGHARRSYYMLPGDYVCLVVADTGVGMPPDVIEHAFEPFFTTKPAGSGTGLGLSMVYGFIKQSGGYIDIDSKLGQGTTITMHLPRTSRPEDKRPVPADHRRWLAKGEETILVTEDDAAVRRVAVRILTKLGYTTREASNGAEALEILERDRSIDMLVADIVLSGGLNGAQLAREAQARLPKLKLLFASGYSQPAVLRETEGAGSIPLLSKPYDAEELGKLIRRLLDGAGKPRSR